MSASVAAEDNRLRELLSGIGAIRHHYIEHSRLVRIKTELQALVDRDNGAGEGGCVALIGASGSGKSKLITDFISAYPLLRYALKNDRGEKAHQAPVVRVSVPDAGTKPLAERLYVAASGLPAMGGRRFDFREESVRILREMKTKVIVFEETHQSYKEHPHLLGAVATFYKDLLNEAAFSIVLAGTSEVTQLFRTSDELKRRMLKILKLDPFPLSEPGVPGRSEFLDILSEFDGQLAAVLGERSGLDSPALALRLHIATGGVIGLLSVLVEQAGRLAACEMVLGGPPRITMRQLSETFISRNVDDRPNPFAIEDDEGLAGLAQQIVEEKPRVEQPRPAVKGRRRRANRDGLFRP